MPARTVTITGLGDFRQLQAELERTGVISAQSNKSIADSAARAGEAAAAQAKEMGASADEQEAAAARAAGAYVDGAERMTQAQKAAAAAAAASADASGKAADEIVAASARAVEAQRAIEKASLDTAASADAAGARLGTAFDEGTSKAGSALTRLGETGASWGIPFSGSLTKMGKQFDEADSKSEKFGSALASTGKLALIAGGALAVGVGVEAVKMGEQYESAQAKIQAATGMSTKSAKEMTSAFGQVGKFVMTSGEESESAFAGVAGQLQATEGHALGTAEAMKVMTAATNLNDAAQGNLTETTAALGAVMQAFHLSTHQAAETSDTLYNVSTRLDVPISSLTTGMDKLHARLGTLSPTLTDMGGLMVALGEHGVQGSRGIQVVSTAMSTLVGGSEKTTEVLKDLGVNIFNSQGKFIGMQGVIAQIGPKLAGLSQQQQIFAEKTLFGAGAYQVMGSVIQSGVGAYQKATDEATKTGTAQAAAAKQAETLHGEFETMKAAVETLGGDLGLILIPKLRDVAKALAEGITWLTKHKEAAIALGVVIAGPLAAAVSVYATTKAMSFITRTGEMAQGMYKFGEKVVEVVPTILAKMGLIGSTSEATAEKVATSNATIEGDNVELATSYGTTAGAAETAGTEIVASADGTAGGVDLALGSTGVGLVIGGLGLAAVELEQHWKEVMSAMESAAKAMASAVESALNSVIGLFNKTVGQITGDIGMVHSSLTNETLPTHKKGEFQGRGVMGEGKTGGSGSVEGQILKFWESKGFSPAAAAGFAGNAALESSDTPSDRGGGLYQQSGLGTAGAEQVAQESVTGQSEEVLSRLSPSLIAQLKHIKNPAEAAKLIESQFEAPKGSQPGEEGYGTAEEGTAHLRQREEAAIKAAGGSNPALSGLMNETSNAKAVKEQESEAKRAKEKAESKQEAAVKKAESKHEEAVTKAEDEAKKQLEKITGAGETLLKKYEANLQSSSPTAIERSLGISTTGKYKSIPGMVETAAETGKRRPLEKELGKSSASSEAGKQESKLVSELKATHQKGLEELASKLVAAHKDALATLAAEMVSTEQTKLGEQLKVQATEEKDRTTLAEHAAADQLNVIKAEQAQQTNAMKAAGQAISDATQSMSDSFSALTQSIEDQSKVMAAASNEVVQGIKDSTNIEVAILGERGLYGLNLIAQKEEVQLDEMKASYDQQIAQAQREEAQLAVNWQQVTALDEQTVDQDKAQADAVEAAAQAHLDSVTVTQDQRIAAAQATVDSAQLHADQLVGNAELKVLAATNAGKKKEEEAAAGLKLAEGQGEKLVKEKEANLKGSVEPAANTAINAASNELARATESWSNAIKQAEQNLAKAKGEGAEQLARAQQNLQGIEDKAAQAEAAKEREVSVEKEKATTQYAGSGLVVNQYGLDYGNATANANELSWALTHQLPV